MLEATERVVNSHDWITIVLMIIITLIVYTKLTDAERFHKLQFLMFNSSYISEYSKATPLLLNFFNSVFLIIFTLISSLILAIVLQRFNPGVNYLEIGYYLKIVSIVFLFIIIRLVIGILLGVLFETEKEQQYLSFVKMSYLSNFSLLMTPLLIISIYSQSQAFTSFFIVIALLLVTFYYFLILKNNQNFIFKRLFYFILYLCALEIAPFLVIYKLIVI